MTIQTLNLNQSKSHEHGTIHRDELQRLYNHGGHDHVLKTLATITPERGIYKITTDWLLGQTTINARGTHGDLRLTIVD